jgi:hypothetical protein
LWMIKPALPIWSHSCAWIDLAALAAVEDDAHDRPLSGAKTWSQT